MENIRIPINLDTDQNVVFKLEQDFDQLEILSLNVSAYEVYAQMTADFGVVVGRVNVNGGFGVHNAKVSVFIPITADDEIRNEIIQLYPFKGVLDKLPNGVRYNLFPRIKQPNFSHQPIGCFPDVTDLTYYPTYLEIYEKYYKFTTTTNNSGDYMLFGVPLGPQYLHMDFDLFDTKSFYITANDLVTEIKTSAGVSSQLSSEITQAINPDFELTSGGTYSVRVKADLDAMPNIYSDNKLINVVPFWGDKSIHEIGITRCDFDLNYQYVPTAILFGSFITMSQWATIRQDYTVHNANDKGWAVQQYGVAQDLKIIAYKHLGPKQVERYGIYSSINDANNDPTGIFMLNLPMYENYYVTNEFGQLIPSDSKRGIPTKGHYVFEFFDDNEADYGNGRRSKTGWDYGGDIHSLITSSNMTVGIRVPADREGDNLLSGWKTNTYDESTLFEYDALNGYPKFYTVQTEFRGHQGVYIASTETYSNVDVRLFGNVISYLPNINPNNSYNSPIDGRNAPSEPFVRGILFSPRFTVEDQIKFSDLTPKTLLYANQITWIPDYNKAVTANYQTKVWDWIYGIGVRHLEGINQGGLFNSLYQDDPNYPAAEARTWFFGDNPFDGDNVPTANYYAQLLSQIPDATNRNINGIHNRFNLSVSSESTAGLFISSTIVNDVNGNATGDKVFFETSIIELTEVLPRLIKDSVYSSYVKNTDNKYEGNYYLFGINEKEKNALNIIKERYFNE